MIIDAHGHVQDAGYPAGSTVYVGPGDMLDAMDQRGISQSWVSPITAVVRDFEAHNQKTYERFVKAHPDRFKAYAVLNPYYPDRMRQELVRCFERFHFLGIKVHSWVQGFVLHQPIIYELMAGAARYQVPVLFHDGTPPYADTLQVAALAGRFPTVPILLGHSGLYDAARAAIDAAKNHDNIWLVLQGPTIGDMTQIVAQAPSDRLLFGSDYCCAGAGPVGQTILDDRLDMFRAACPDPDLQRQIFQDNALRLGNKRTGDGT